MGWIVIGLALGQLLVADADAGAAQPPFTGKPVNLLAGLQPKADKAANAERMTDGKAADPGDNWQSVLTSVIEKDGSVTWDLGAPRDFEGVWIQADNNDIYVLETSDDGTSFRTAWQSSTVDAAGMQIRTGTNAHARGRYVRLTGHGGDGLFSVSELGIFANGAEAKAFVPQYVRNPANPEPQPFDGNWIVIGVVLAGIVMLVRRMKPAEAPAGAGSEEKKEEPGAKG